MNNFLSRFYLVLGGVYALIFLILAAVQFALEDYWNAALNLLCLLASYGLAYTVSRIFANREKRKNATKRPKFD